MSNKRRRRTSQQPPIKGQFIVHRADMRRAPAWRALSNNALRALLRLELEHLNHGGRDNGRLPVSYDDFQRSGIRRQSVAAAINELVVFGFIVITEVGRRGSADVRRPSIYRLTYLRTFENGEWQLPTDDWERIPKSTIQKHSSRCKNA